MFALRFAGLLALAVWFGGLLALGAVAAAGRIPLVPFVRFFGCRFRCFGNHLPVAIIRRRRTFDYLGIGTKVRPLAVAVFADGQQRRVGIGDDHADEFIAADQRDALDA